MPTWIDGVEQGGGGGGGIPPSEKGQPNGVATLDGSGKVPDSQINDDITRDSELQAHIDDNTNPHNVTAAQTGAAPLVHTHVAADVTDFDTEVADNTDVAANTTHRGLTNNPHSVTAAQVGAAALVHTHVALDVTDFDTAVDANTNVSANTTHRGLTNNPHSVTPAQIGAALASHTHIAADVTDFDTEVANNTDVAANTTHRGLTNNPHSVTAAQVGAAALVHTHVAADVTDFDTEVSNNLDVAANTTHRGLTNNPHSVTAVQVGAIPTSEKGAANGVATLDSNSEVVQKLAFYRQIERNDAQLDQSIGSNDLSWFTRVTLTSDITLDSTKDYYVQWYAEFQWPDTGREVEMRFRFSEEARDLGFIDREVEDANEWTVFAGWDEFSPATTGTKNFTLDFRKARTGGGASTFSIRRARVRIREVL